MTLSNEPAQVADEYLGNVNDSSELASQVAQDKSKNQCLEVFIERQDCRKGRIFTQATSGHSVGIVKDRNWTLRDGDVLMTAQQQRVLVSIQKQQIIALQFERKAYNAPMDLVSLGHAIGNQHWPMSVQGETIYVDAIANADRIESTLREIADTLGIKGLHIVREFKSADQSIDFSGSHGHVH